MHNIVVQMQQRLSSLLSSLQQVSPHDSSPRLYGAALQLRF